MGIHGEKDKKKPGDETGQGIWAITIINITLCPIPVKCLSPVKEGNKMKNYRISAIRSNRIYDERMLRKAIGIHPQTFHRWIKDGLPTLPGPLPYKVLGDDVRIFLEKRRNERCHKLGPNEMYCLSCRAGRHPLPGSIVLEKTRKKLGKNTLQVILHAKCPVCGGKMMQYSSERKESLSSDEQRDKGINGIGYRSSYVDPESRREQEELVCHKLEKGVSCKTR